jgi:hypothetical protein
MRTEPLAALLGGRVRLGHGNFFRHNTCPPTSCDLALGDDWVRELSTLAGRAYLVVPMRAVQEIEEFRCAACVHIGHGGHPNTASATSPAAAGRGCAGAWVQG